MAKGIRLVDKKAFLFIQEKFHASKNFWKKYPLMAKHSCAISKKNLL